MSILLPYNFTRIGNKYVFQTDNSVVYSIEFTDGSFYFLNLPPHIPIFEFSITVLNVVDTIGQPYDSRIEATIVAILNTFFSNNTNSLIYVCDNLDNRHQGRFRKFDIWFKRNKNDFLEKYDVDFTVQGMQIMTSLIVHTLNPDKEVIVSLFFDTYK